MAGYGGGWRDEAYLTHRLVEEMNDRPTTRLGALLIALDTTMVNLISSMKRHTTPSTPCDAARFTRN